MTDTQQPDETTPAPTRAPAKSHGDPLLAASEGATEGTEGSRHGHDATAPDRQKED